MSTIETATLNKLIIKNYILTKHPLCIHQYDTMECYDTIIRTHATINSRNFFIPDNMCKLHLKTHDNMEFKSQIDNNTSKITYKSTKELPMHDQGQGTCNGRTHWTFISVPMMEIVRITQKKRKMDHQDDGVHRRQTSLY